MKYLFFLVAGVALQLPVAAHAQGCQRTPADAEGDLPDVASTFYDPEYAAVRGSEIVLLTSADPQYVVRDDSICQVVLDQAVAYLRGNNTTWRDHQEGNFEATVYRFGPYYAAALAVERSAATYQNGVLSGIGGARAPFLVFRSDTLSLVKVLY